jgi:large subunit ribosomal protein L10
VLNLEQKKAIVAEVVEVATDAQAAFAAEYRGLTVDEMTELRATARNAGMYMRVVKNTLARRAVEDTDFACMQDAFIGPLILGFTKDDPAAAAKLLRDFTKQHEHLVIKALALSGKRLEVSDLARLADMPTRDQAISMLMGTMQAPIGKLATLLNEVPSKLVRTLAAVRDQKEAA